MSRELSIAVKNKIAQAAEGAVYVCGNSDYVVNFDFDDEWAAFPVKTARFIHNGVYTDVVFHGDQCPVPVISNVFAFKVGVYAGDLHTTTSASVKCKKSILCDGGVPADPVPDVYTQIMELLNKGNDKPASNAVLYVEQDLTPEQQAQARKNIGANVGPGGLAVTDDGNGNVTITSSGSVSITDDGNGNVTIA
jgi:hypothetical protein